jgi:hypothetical protein
MTQPDALVICWERAPEEHLSVVELSYRAFEEWRLHSRSFTNAGRDLFGAACDRDLEGIVAKCGTRHLSYGRSVNVLAED